MVICLINNEVCTKWHSSWQRDGQNLYIFYTGNIFVNRRNFLIQCILPTYMHNYVIAVCNNIQALWTTVEYINNKQNSIEGIYGMIHLYKDRLHWQYKPCECFIFCNTGFIN